MKTPILTGLAAAALALAPASSSAGNLAETAAAANSSGPYAGSFDTLLAAVGAADPAVLAKLSSPGQLTVFAPTDDAFAAAGVDAANVATAFSRADLTKILLYHVANGRQNSKAVTSKKQIRTLAGMSLSVNGAVLTDELGRDSNIIVTDVEADNGVIHAIDSVLLPFQP
ncbi:MAG TPA: fasciclin domain-containing protein [bacterium]|nr:fasciclin domain-containing protein [bacterium]